MVFEKVPTKPESGLLHGRTSLEWFNVIRIVVSRGAISFGSADAERIESVLIRMSKKCSLIYESGSGMPYVQYSILKSRVNAVNI